MGKRGPKPGGKRPAGAGRKKGTPNRKTRMLEEILRAKKVDPVEGLLEILNKECVCKDCGGNLALNQRDKANIYMEFMNFLYPKRKSIDHSLANLGDDENVTFKTEWSKNKIK